DLRRVHLVGHSLGGWIAAEMLVRDRARFQSMTLLAPAGLRVEGVPAGDTFIWAPDEAIRNLFHDQRFAEALLALTPSEEQMDIALKNRFTATKLGWQPRWFDPDLEKWLHRVKLPALVVWGDDDKVMPPAYASLWRERVPDARLVMIEGSGHLPHVEKAEPVGLFDMRQMARPFDHDETRIGHSLAPQARIGGRHHLVVIAPHHQRRQLDAMQPFLEIGIEPARLPAELRRGKAVLQGDVHLLFAGRQRKQRLGEALVMEQIADRFVGRPDEGIARGHALDAQPRRRQQRHALKARAVAHQHLGRDPAAERVADEMHAAQVERL